MLDRNIELTLPPWDKVSHQARELFDFMAGTPLVSGSVLSGMLRRPAPYSYPLLRQLTDAQVVSSVGLGAGIDRAQRHSISAYGQQFLSSAAGAWHEDWALAYLLERFPAVDFVYEAAASVRDMGRLSRFQWYKGAAWDAVAQYEDGWALFFWSGLLQGERHLNELFSRMGVDLMEHRAVGPVPWPGRMCFVVSDLWQRELVYRAARRRGCGDQVETFCVSDRSVSEAPNPEASRGGLAHPVAWGSVGNWPWEKRVASAPWSSGDGRRLYRLLIAVAEWPRLYIDFARAIFRETPGSRTTQVALQRQRERDRPFLDSHRERNGHRYVINTRGYALLARIDGVSTGRMPAGVRGADETRFSKAHEDGVMELVRHFIAAGIPVAAGWRSRERWLGGGIEPDAMVLLTRSPFGPGWHYIEYERSARNQARAERKLGRYLYSRRQDGFPVIVAAWSDRAEAHFQNLGRESGAPLKLLTTTIERLKRCGPVGDTGCWSHYGEPVSLG